MIDEDFFKVLIMVLEDFEIWCFREIIIKHATRV